MADKMGMEIIDHPCPYTLVNYDEKIQVVKQVFVAFFVCSYIGVLYNVIHMDDCHVNLGKPWKSYHNVVHNPFKYMCVCVRVYSCGNSLSMI